MKFSSPYLSASFLLSVLVVAGCAAPVQEQAESGFLRDYSRLVKTDDSSFVYVGQDLGNYSSFMIDPVALLFTQDPENPEFNQAELDEIRDYIVAELTEALTEDNAYKIVASPAPGIARIRIGITKIDASTGAYNVLIYTKVTGAGLGGIATESEVVDSITGKQLAAAIHWGSGSRFLRAGFTPAGDAKILIGRWVKLARKAIDEMHGKND
jgi:hypothetical protein